MIDTMSGSDFGNERGLDFLLPASGGQGSASVGLLFRLDFTANPLADVLS